MSLRVTICRHGESVDNTKSLWAGHKDSPLTRHGMNQAKALGKHLQDLQFQRIYCSDLKRAHWTAKEVHSANSTADLPDPVVDPLIREQFFGKAEGSSWQTGAHAHSDWDKAMKRQFRFEDGECLEDVSARANEFINRVIKPWLAVSTVLDTTEPPHICIVAHGITISELVRAILLLNPNQNPRETRLGSLANTGFHQLQLTLKPSALPLPQNLIHDCQRALDSLELPILLPTFRDGPRLPVTVQVLAQQRDGHLSGIKRQSGGIGSSAYDEKQRDLKSFFGGGGGTNAVGR